MINLCPVNLPRIRALSSKTRFRTVALAAGIALCAGNVFAVTLDLTAAGSDGSINGALFTTNDAQSTGTGVINPFLRLQANGNETGLNSDSSVANLLEDTKAGSWTHDIMLGDIGTTQINMVNYYIFLLDINQTGSNPELSLDTFDLYTRATSITDGTADSLADVQAGGTLRYSMDSGADSNVLLNYLLNPGSGGGDLWVFVPVSFFAGASLTDYLYLYTQFGFTEGYESNDGFEEWATISSSAPPVPDGGLTVMLVGLGLVGVGAARRFSLC